MLIDRVLQTVHDRFNVSNAEIKFLSQGLKTNAVDHAAFHDSFVPLCVTAFDPLVNNVR